MGGELKITVVFPNGVIHRISRHFDDTQSPDQRLTTSCFRRREIRYAELQERIIYQQG